MKFDIFKWSEEKPNEEIKATQARLQVRCSKESALYVTSQGVQVLVGVGYAFDVTAKGVETFLIDGPDDTRVFFENPLDENYYPSGEVFTNTDRLPMESGSVLEVSRAVRKMKLEQRAMLREMAHQRQLLEAARPEPEKKPDETVEPDPAKEETGEPEKTVETAVE